MSTRLRVSLVCISIVTFCCITESRYIHHHHQAHHLNRKHVHHRHYERQAASPIFFTPIAAASATSDVALPSITAGDAVAEDIEQIQEGMNSFSKDLSSFFDVLQQWLRAIQDLFSNGELMPQTDPGRELGPQLSTSIPPVSPPVTLHAPVPVLTIAPENSTPVQPSLCRPAAGAGPLVPCPESRTTSLTTITSTSTRSKTITTYATISHANVSMPANGTGVLVISTAAPYPDLGTYWEGRLTASVPGTLTAQYIATATTILSAPVSLATATRSLPATPTPTPYTFNATSQDNVAVYYGTSPNTRINGLLDLCANPNVDIVILSFVSDFFSAGGYPTLNFGPACVEPTSAQRVAAPGLRDCSALAPQIAGCQQEGKKVLVSLGG